MGEARNGQIDKRNLMGEARNGLVDKRTLMGDARNRQESRRDLLKLPGSGLETGRYGGGGPIVCCFS